MKKYFSNLVALLIGCVIAFALAELVLHFYNPLPSKVRGNKIQLKTNLSRKIIIDPPVNGLDSVINYTANSIGFRGQEPPEDTTGVYTIITVGGSTTECSLLDDEKTWSQLLYYHLKNSVNNIWVNNAGIDGCSTYGHLILLEDYLIKLKPDMIVFLIGVNDMGVASFEHEDSFLIHRRESFLNSLIKKSELANLLNNLYESYKAKQVNVYHGAELGGKDQQISIEERNKQLNFHKSFLPVYKKRVTELVLLCLNAGIQPVLVTQPLLSDLNSLAWENMQLYNSISIQVANEHHIPVIDLGSKLEKKSEYFYDSMHYTNLGAEKVAEIISSDLVKHIKQ